MKITVIHSVKTVEVKYLGDIITSMSLKDIKTVTDWKDWKAKGRESYDIFETLEVFDGEILHDCPFLISPKGFKRACNDFDYSFWTNEETAKLCNCENKNLISPLEDFFRYELCDFDFYGLNNLISVSRLSRKVVRKRIKEFRKKMVKENPPPVAGQIELF